MISCCNAAPQVDDGLNSVYSDQESLGAFFEHLSAEGTNDTLKVSGFCSTACLLLIWVLSHRSEEELPFLTPVSTYDPKDWH